MNSLSTRIKLLVLLGICATTLAPLLSISRTTASTEQIHNTEFTDNVAMALDGFDFPVGSPDGSGWRNNLNGLQFLQQFNYGGSCGLTYHPGHDFNKDATSGDQDRYEPVYAVAEGVVIDSAYYGTSTWGNIILIEHTLPNGTKVWSLYGHLEDRWVQNGATVSKRQQIGRVGKGDGSLSAHLHFEIRKVSLTPSAFPCGQSQTYVTDRYHNPIPYIDSNRVLTPCSNGAGTQRNRENGPAVYPPGSVLKTASNATVYLIDSEGRKRPITSGSVLAQLYNQSTDPRTSTNFTNWVITVPQDVLDLYETGGNISAAQPGNGKPFPDGKLISYNGEISIVTGGGRRRPFTSGSRFTALGYVFCSAVTVSQSEYNNYAAGPAVDAMPILTTSVTLTPAAPYNVGNTITGSFAIRNLGYEPISFSNLGIGCRRDGNANCDMNFVARSLPAGSSTTFTSQPYTFTNPGSYNFYAAYQESNGHWTTFVPVLPGVIRSRAVSVGNATPTPTPTATPTPTPTPTVTPTPTPTVTPTPAPSSSGRHMDFDGDGKTEIGIFRPSSAEWWIKRSSDGNVVATQFGGTSDRIVPADYTGDGKSDIAVWRSTSGEWFVLRSDDLTYYSFPFGTNADIPVTADFDADHKADAAVFRSSNATWYVRRASDGATFIQQFGTTGDQPTVADYDGDQRADIAIFRPSNGQWWINRSTDGLIATTFGDSNVKPVQGDYTGDGRSDVAFWRPATGDWFVLRSEDFSFFSFPFGTTGDTPAPGDYDGDGKFDATVFRSSNATWYSQRSTAGTLIQQFGADGDRPIPNAFVP